MRWNSGIGASTLLTPWLLGAAQTLYSTVPVTIADNFAVLTLVRVACSAAVLMVPTALMGATLPLVVRSSVVTRGDLGPRVGLLYAVNAGGAITGALLAGFYLIGTVGIRSTFLVAAALNAWSRSPPSRCRGGSTGAHRAAPPPPRTGGRTMAGRCPNPSEGPLAERSQAPVVPPAVARRRRWC